MRTQPCGQAGMKRFSRLASCSRGQSIIEFAVISPLLLLLSLGVAEFGHLLLNQHVVTKLTREGSNLISRNTTLQDAAAAMKTMSSNPVDFDNGSKLILSVLRKSATTGSVNFDKIILYQRYEYGSLAGASSALVTRGAGSFGGAPEYQAANSDNDSDLQITNLPAGLVMGTGGLMYVTEIYTDRDPLTPFEKFGVPIPKRLYSIAYF